MQGLGGLSRRSWRWLQPWPLLIAAIAAFVAAGRLLPETEARAFVGFSLVALGAVCLGAWIALLSAHDYPGQDRDDQPPPEP